MLNVVHPRGVRTHPCTATAFTPIGETGITDKLDQRWGGSIDGGEPGSVGGRIRPLTGNDPLPEQGAIQESHSVEDVLRAGLAGRALHDLWPEP